MYLVIPEYCTPEIKYRLPVVNEAHLYSVLDKLGETPVESWTAEHIDSWTTHLCVWCDQRILNFRDTRRRQLKMLHSPAFALNRRATKNSAEGRVRARAVRNERLKHSTPAWANRKKMAALYLMAQLLKELTGVEYHVDHDVPLAGKNVCGLNWEGNMVLIPKHENLKKGCKHSSDC